MSPDSCSSFSKRRATDSVNGYFGKYSPVCPHMKSKVSMKNVRNITLVDKLHKSIDVKSVCVAIRWVILFLQILSRVITLVSNM